jgi:hypothetical protein
MELCKRIIFSLYRRVPHLSLTIPRVPHPFAPLRKGEIRWDSISHVLNLNLTRQVSGHDFSILPDATAGSKGCVVVPKAAPIIPFLAPKARGPDTRFAWRGGDRRAAAGGAT